MPYYVIRAHRTPSSKVERRRHFFGWISMWGYTVSNNIETARRFEVLEQAESFALLLVVKVPDYIGRLEVVPMEAWLDKHGKINFREVRDGTVLR